MFKRIGDSILNKLFKNIDEVKSKEQLALDYILNTSKETKTSSIVDYLKNNLLLDTKEEDIKKVKEVSDKLASLGLTISTDTLLNIDQLDTINEILDDLDDMMKYVESLPKDSEKYLESSEMIIDKIEELSVLLHHNIPNDLIMQLSKMNFELDLKKIKIANELYAMELAYFRRNPEEKEKKNIFTFLTEDNIKFAEILDKNKILPIGKYIQAMSFYMIENRYDKEDIANLKFDKIELKNNLDNILDVKDEIIFKLDREI